MMPRNEVFPIKLRYSLNVYMWFAEDETPGLRRSELVGWYLKEIESEIDSEAELIEKKTIVEKVIERLVHHVSRRGITYLYKWCLFCFIDKFMVQMLYLSTSFRNNFLKVIIDSVLFVCTRQHS